MVLPLSDDNSGRSSIPIVTWSIILLNVVVFFVLQGSGANTEFTYAYSTVPAEIVSGRDLVTENRIVRETNQHGQVDQYETPGLQPTPIPVYLTLVTSMFMHGGLMHLVGNMWFLWIFGDNIEHDMGPFRYLVFYLLCGIVASLAHVLLNTSGPNAEIPCLGASGAISAVMGAYLILHPKRRVTVLLLRVVTQVPGYVAVGLWFLFQVVSGLAKFGGTAAGVAYGAHIGGFVIGALFAIPFMAGRPKSR